VRETLPEMLAGALAAARAKGLEFRVEVADSVPEVISIDTKRLASVLDQLCDNAVRFTERGHCHVRIDADSPRGPRPCLQIAIEDTGIGIASQDQQKIFELFTQVDESSERKHQGAGLGLALSRGLVTLLGGTLTLESERGRGSTFRVRVPYNAVKDDARVAALAGDKDETGASAAPDAQAVLVVDDSRTNRMLLTHFLRKMHWEIDEAENGKEAVAKAAERHYSVIFMDCEMPVMDGFQATREIRKRGDSTPIVAVTAYVSDDARKRCLAVGMNEFIGKPISAGQIRSAMRQWAGREEAQG
jgi:CheY-like chemotaxis protein